MSPYRGGAVEEIVCPRCKQKLPPLDVATCACGGVWISAFAASEVLSPLERRADPVTRWWRVREPCPMCGEQMVLYGEEPGLLQGCDLHGYFIDADIVGHTSLARGIDHAALDRKREDTDRVAAEREARDREAVRRAHERAENDRREAELAQLGVVKDPATAATEFAVWLEEQLSPTLGAHGAAALVGYIRSLELRIRSLEHRV